MKKLFLLLFLTPCLFAGVTMSGVYLSGISIPLEPVILCLGDSITVGTGGTYSDSYRGKLQDLLGLGIYNFIGFADDGQNKYDRDHSAAGGNTVGDILTRFNSTEAGKLTPYIEGSKVIVFAGINDAYASTPVATVAATMQTLLTAIHVASPNIAIYVCLINDDTTGLGTTWVTAYNVLLSAMVTSFKATHAKTFEVDIRAAIEANANWKTELLDDIIHPNDAGYDVIGTAIYNGIVANE